MLSTEIEGPVSIHRSNAMSIMLAAKSAREKFNKHRPKYVA